MKRTILIISLILSNTLFATQTVEDEFAKANKLYQQEKYSEALTIYKQIEAQELQSDDLFYNMANAFYKMNQVAPAIYYFEKALKINPNNSDARHNLGFAQQMAIDNIEALPKTISQRFSDGVIQRLSYNAWALIAVVLSFLFAALFLLYHFSYGSGYKRFYFVSSIISASLVLLCVAFAYSNFDYVQRDKSAIVFAQQTEVRTAPANSSEVSFELHEGTKVQLLESLDDWHKIKIADGKIGWMYSDDLKEL